LSLSENPGLVTAARMRRIEAIVRDLADIEYSQVSVRQAVRHDAYSISRAVLHVSLLYSAAGV
jgi:hypothetical protein